MTKIIISTLLILFGLSVAKAGDVTLLLVPVQARVKPGAEIVFDLYAFNTTSHTVTIPTLETYSVMYTLEDPKGRRPPRHNGSATATTDVPPKILAAKRFAREHVRIPIEAEKGDIIEIYAWIGHDTSLRTNSCILVCR